nr:MAG TPA: hypothetical protein [Caudoviricetes sp.]
MAVRRHKEAQHAVAAFPNSTPPPFNLFSIRDIGGFCSYTR